MPDPRTVIKKVKKEDRPLTVETSCVDCDNTFYVLNPPEVFICAHCKRISRMNGVLQNGKMEQKKIE